jgi:secreted trypsin-like serine protease
MEQASNRPGADPLLEHRELADRLSHLIAPDDQRRSLLAFTALMNLVDRFTREVDDGAEREARTLLMRGLGLSAVAPTRSTRAAAAPAMPVPPADSVFSDPVFLENARKVFRDSDRVVGGVETGDHPDCVAVGGPEGWCCTGTLVAPNVVVTAAHCHFGGCKDRVLVGADVDDVAATVIGVASSHPHPDYGTAGPNSDLCVLVLDSDAGVAPRAVADATAIEDAMSVRIVGFGNVDTEGSTGYGKCRMVDVPLAAADPKFGADPAMEFVAGAPFLDRDSCNGDSGGPAYVQVDGDWYLAGATSRATASAFRRCGDGGVYTSVPVFADWVRDVPGGHWS